jgi:ATP-dependent helicase HrpB
MAELLGERVGASVGYQIRLERKISSATVIEVITEGVLTRRLIADPELKDVGVVIFDEFHERNIHADIGLALAYETATVLRTDLKLIVMSATLGDSLSDERFAHVRRYVFQSSPHPVSNRYLSPEPRSAVWEQVAKATRAALASHPGDLLAFLPGAYEIQRCRELLVESVRDTVVLPLYGELPYEEQRAALEPAREGRRRVVLATTIAETSLTIDGVRIVVDSGLHRTARSDIAGSSELLTERIALDAADQRAGRAGRTAPGVCIRLWSEQEHKTLRPAREPEILRSDLTQPLLDLAAWGCRDPGAFHWITPPPERAVDSALSTLRSLGALRLDGRLTETGLLLSTLGTHPRIGTMCLQARASGEERIAAALIPLLEERIPREQLKHSVDVVPLVEQLIDEKRSAGLGRLQDHYRRWLRRIGEIDYARRVERKTSGDLTAVGFLLGAAFPERIARRRDEGDGRYLLASGVGAVLPPGDQLSRCRFLVVASLQQRPDDSLITLAAPLDESLFEQRLQHLLMRQSSSGFDEARGVFVAMERVMLGALTIREARRADLSADELRAALESYLRTSSGLARLPFSEEAQRLQSRCAWARSVGAAGLLPDLSTEALCASDPFWLATYLPHDGRLTSIQASQVEAALRDRLLWQGMKELEQIAPETIALPSGKARRVEYLSPEGPVVRATIQELFGMHKTPLIGQYRIPATLHILSPARRPIQVTKDLASFWSNGYPQVRKELRGRYPKHRWPESPSE